MKLITSNLFRCFLPLMLGLIAMAGEVWAETESAVVCVEGSEPTALAYGDHTSGCSISPALDTDTFVFAGSANDHVRINVMSTSTNMDPQAQVRDSVGAVIASQSCSNGGCTFSLDIQLPSSGNYLLTISDVGNNEAGNYTLQLEKIWPAQLLQRLDYDMEISDSINPVTDIDHYYFNGTAGTTIRLHAFSTSTNMDPTVELRDPNGTLVLDGAVDGASCSNGGCTFAVELQPALTGTYSLILYDSATNEAGNYQLSLWCIFGPCDSDGNGKPDAAPPILSYVSPVSDSISPAVDGDFFSFSATAGTTIRLHAFSTSTNMDPTVELRDPNGTLVLDGAVDGASCSNGSCTFAVELQPALTGTYSLILYDSATNEAGNYQLSLWCILGDCDSDADGVNDTDWKLINYGDTKIDDISPAVDGDFYVFKGTVGDQVRLTGFSATTNMDPTIEVYGPTGVRVLNAVADGASCNNGGCTFAVDLFPAITGTYSMLVYDLNTNEAGRYHLGLECVFSPGDFVCDDLMTAPACDNCSVVANTAQRDTDGDGYGNYCDPDFDNNLVVNVTDLAYMKTNFFTTDPDADLDGNGVVNAADLAILKRMFFQPPGPSCVAP